jgi:hypothetical protein
VQGGFLELTVGIQFFLLFGYLFYFMFRSYSEPDARPSLLAYVLVFIGLITLGLIASLLLVVPAIAPSDRAGVFLIAILDEIVLALVGYDYVRTTRRDEDSTSAD